MLRGVNTTRDLNAQLTYLMEQTINARVSPSKMSSDMRSKAKDFCFDPDATKVDNKNRKRAKTLFELNEDRYLLLLFDNGNCRSKKRRS